MAFKMKKPTFFNVGNKYNEQNPSAAFQQKKSKEDLLAEGFTPRDADLMIKEGATTGELKETKGKPSMDKILAEMKLDNQEGFTKKEIADMSEEERIGNLDGYAEGDFAKMKKAAILKLSKSGGMNYGKKMKDPTFKQTKTPTGPIAKKKKKTIKDRNIESKMHNVKETKDRATNLSNRIPKPLKPTYPDFSNIKSKTRF